MNLWDKINKDMKFTKKDLFTFRSGKINHRLALPDPKKGDFYMRQFLFQAARELTADQWGILKATKNRTYGHPITVRYHGIDVDLDYLQAALEFDFIYEAANLKRIIEIGAGYGRTAHTILSNSICEYYVIVDLPPCLELAKKYLKHVLSPEKFFCLDFIRADKFNKMKTFGEFDLAINIDSFAEMPVKDVNRYLRFISKTCQAFYVKNPVGKYSDPVLNNRPALTSMAMQMGPLRRIVDIHDNYDIFEQAQRFISAYRPEGFSVYRSSKADPWSYYMQAMYHRRV